MITHGMSSVLCEMRSQTKKNRDMSKDQKLEGWLQICLVHCQKSKTSKLNRQSTLKNYQRKVTSRRQATTEVPPRLYQECESGIDLAERNETSIILQTPEPRRAADDVLVDKVENGNMFFQLRMLDKVLPSLKSKIGMENLSKELQNILSDIELKVNHSSSKLGETLEFSSKESSRIEYEAEEPLVCDAHKFKLNAKKFAESTNDNVEMRVATDEKLDAPAESVQLQPEELSRKAEKIVELSKNKKASSNKVWKLNPIESGTFLKFAELCRVILDLKKFCESVFQTLKFIVERQADTEEFYGIAGSNIKQLIYLRSRLPDDIIKKYKCAKMFHEFSTGFYVEYFSNFFKKDALANYLLCTDVKEYLPELARWLELHIPLLVSLGNEVSYLSTSSSQFRWRQFSRLVGDRQIDMFTGFNFFGSPCENEDFAYELISLVNVFIEDVSFVLSGKNEYLTEKADLKC